uniref:Uncharacterized protein n=1 Tax=Caenorhabditis japonica TaxID=281687 RepID=A0A8R1I2J7_CAEJA
MSKRAFRPVHPHQGFLIRPVKVLSSGEELLYCTERLTSTACFASAKLSNGIITMDRPHSGHVPDEGLVMAKIARNSLRESAATSAAPPRDLLHEMRTEFGVQPVVMAGTQSSLRRMISRARDTRCPDSDVADKPDPQFQGKMTLDNDGQKFLLFDSISPTGGRNVAFGSELAMELLSSATLLLTDGTFSIARDPFCQLWTLHGNFTDSTTAFVYVLMEKRSIVDYTDVLKRLKDLIPSWDPSDYLGGGALYDYWGLLRSLPFGDVTEVEDDFEALCNLIPQSVRPDAQSETILKTIR